MSATNAFETDLLKAIFQAVFGGSATSLFRDSAAPATNIYVSLHTADPGETGDQTSSETSYTGYSRVAVARTSGGWTVSGNTADNAAEITFDQCTGGAQTITHVGVGLSSSGTGTLLLTTALDTSLVLASGATPLFAIGELNFTCD
jgi:hypothetical protein